MSEHGQFLGSVNDYLEYIQQAKRRTLVMVGDPLARCGTCWKLYRPDKDDEAKEHEHGT